MTTSRIMNVKTMTFVPFILIILLAVLLIEKQKEPPAPPLLPPSMALNTLDTRGANERQFALSDLSGDTIQLSDLQGKAVLLNFFATWCPSCRNEMASLEQLYQHNKDKGFIVLGVAADSDVKAVSSLIKETGVTFPVVLDPDKEAFNQYFVRAIPITYFLDRLGRIAGMYPGEADWNSKKAQSLVDQLLQESYPEHSSS